MYVAFLYDIFHSFIFNPWFNPKGGNKHYITESANKLESNMFLMSSQLGAIFAKTNRLSVLSERDIILSALFQLPLSPRLSLYSTYKKALVLLCVSLSCVKGILQHNYSKCLGFLSSRYMALFACFLLYCLCNINGFLTQKL